MASPYYVAPQGGYDIGAGLSGLASSIDRRREMEAEEEERRRALEATEAAQKRFAAAKTAAMEAYRSGDPDQIANVMMAYPEVSAALNQSVNFKSKATRDNMLESLRIGIVSPERIPELIKTRAEFVRSQGGDPKQTEDELARYEKDPDAYVQSLKSTWAALDFPSFNNWRSTTDPNYNKVKVRSQQAWKNGLVQQSTDQGIITYAPGGRRVYDEDEAARLVEEANQYESGRAAEKAGAVTRAELSARQEVEPGLEREITRAKEEAKAAVEKQVAERSASANLDDAVSSYNALSKADLNRIYGRGEKWYPEFFRSQEGLDLIAQRDLLVNMLKLGARGQLKGQGAITDTEQGMLGKAVTALENPNISPDLAKKELDRAIKILQKNAGMPKNAKQAPDGKWYVPDPNRPGKYLRID